MVPDQYLALPAKGQTCKRLVCGGVVSSAAGIYLAAVDRFGSFGYSVKDLAAASAGVRQAADQTLGSIVSPRMTAVDGSKLKCARGRSEVAVAPGGAVLLRPEAGGTVSLRRFGDQPTIQVGTLQPGQAGTIRLPADGTNKPWLASASSGNLEVCKAHSAAAQ